MPKIILKWIGRLWGVEGREAGFRTPFSLAMKNQANCSGGLGDDRGRAI